MPNLFEVCIFGESDVPSPDDPIFVDTYSGATQPTIYYCSAYEIPAPGLGLKRDPLTKRFYVDKYNLQDTMSITWQENNNLEVWGYHQKWFYNFYDRSKDRYVSSAAGKKRNAQILIQQYKESDRPSSLTSASTVEPELQEIYTINLVGLVPQSLPPLHGDWNQDASNSLGLVIRYYVDYISINYKGSFLGAQ